jgi:hypothetical protein
MTVVEVGSLLSRRITVALLLALAGLWTSGVLWLVLHYLLATPGEFGESRHPLEAPVLLVHGLVAMLVLFVLGWFTARHAQPARSGQRRHSGGWLAVAVAVLVLTGCLQLFLAGDALHSVLSLGHEVLGAALVLPILVHGGRFNALRRASSGRAPHRGVAPQ